MKRFVFMAMTLFLAVTINAQDVQQRYDQAVNLLNSNLDEAKLFLEKWEKEDASNPELFSLWFNYYFAMSRQSVVELNTERSNRPNAYAISDSTGKTVGYLQERLFYNDSLLTIAFNWLDKGIAANPDRLDFYFGKATASLRADKDSLCVDILQKAMDRSVQIGPRWLWTFGESRENEPDLLTGSIQDFFISLYEKNNMQYAERLLVAATERFPENIMFMSNAGILALEKGDFERALQLFQTAEKINGNDYVVLMNIAFTYRNLGNIAEAKNYYRKVIENCSPEGAADAERLLKELEN